MPGPSVLIIALATNELSSPRTIAMLNTAHQMLGDRVSVRVEVFDKNGNEQALLNSRPTSAYAWLSWDNTNNHVAHLRCFIPAGNRWVQRDVTFAPQDPDVESGRTLGFVIASTYVEANTPQTALAEPVPPKTSERKSSSDVRSGVANRSRFILGGAASFAGPRDATSMGAWLGIQLKLPLSLSLGVASDIRFGTIGRAQSSERFVATGLVGTLRAWPRTGHFWLGPQLFLAAEHVSFTHQSEDDVRPSTQAAWVPRLDLLAVGNWDLSQTSTLSIGLGANYRFGDTDVYVHGVVKGHLPAWVGIGRLGFGTRF